MKLFFDSEWAIQPDLSHALVSLGIVSEDDRFVFYAERDPLPADAPDFVQAVVYPLLERGPSAMNPARFAENLRGFITHVREATGTAPTLCCDYVMDRQMFMEGWEGVAAGTGLVPRPEVVWYALQDLDPHYSAGLERYFADEPLEHARRHHALVDARAARAGYLFARQRMDASG